MSDNTLMDDDDSVNNLFQNYNEVLTQENLKREEIRSLVRELEDNVRCITNIIQAIHHPNGILKVKEISSKCKSLLETTRLKIGQLAEKVEPQSYFKYHEHWRYTIQKCVFVVVFVHFINWQEEYKDSDTKTEAQEKDAASTKEENIPFMDYHQCASVLNLSVDGGFHLELDDYLCGLLMLASELARLSTNAVTSGNYVWPLKIGVFVARLDQAFRLLNLKNDQLRRRYDALKYDLKRVEEVTYDLSVRSLVK